MTPDERQLIQGLFDRMRANGPVEKDRDADSVINQSVRQTPDAAYLLVQSVLAQEHYLQEAGNRIQDLEARLQDMEAEIQQLQAQAQQAQPRSGGSFLGGLFGGSKPEAQPAGRSAASVPAVGSGRSGGSFGQPVSPWGNTAGAAQRSPSQGSAWGAQSAQGGYAQQPPMQQAPAASGGPSFMRSAMTTAAGVAGGMLAANAIQGMLGGSHGSAHAAGSSGTAASGDNSPFAVNNQADLDREANMAQDAAQDQEFESEHGATEDDDSSADWGAADEGDEI